MDPPVADGVAVGAAAGGGLHHNDAVRPHRRNRATRRAVVVGVVVGGCLVAAGSTAATRALTSAAGASTPSGTPAGGSGATTIAGDGRPGFGGDGGSAANAVLDAPSGLAEDGSGDLFIADTGNCRVREVPSRNGVTFGRPVRAGIIVTVAGGPCRDTANPPPAALATDAAGDLFIDYPTADRVAVLAATAGTVFGTPASTGKPVTVAGTGHAGFGGDGGSATAAQLDEPGGIAVDPTGDLLIADTGNCRVRMVAAAGGTRDGVALATGQIATVAGTGVCGSSGDGGPALQAQVWDPGALATDPSGDVFVADQGNRTVRVLAPQATTLLGITVGAGDLATVAGEGSYGPYLVDGLSATGMVGELNFPTGLAVDTAGNLVVADGDSHVIREVANTSGELRGMPVAPGDLDTVAGAMSTGALRTGTAWIGPRMLDPVGITVSPHGALLYADHDGDVVRSLSSS
jgi:NHL repeat-containing protein